MVRNRGIELLRIILMIMIILGHLFCHTEIRVECELFSAEWFFVWGIQTISVSAVNCFVLIAGYFMINSEFKVKKSAQLWGKVLFYSIAIFILLIITGLGKFEIGSLLDAFFPVFRRVYWFFSCYILLYLLSPLLNAAIRNMSKKGILFAIFVILVFFYVLPVFSVVFYQYDPEEGMSILGFITLYIIGAGIRKLDLQLKKSVCLISLVVNCSIILLSKICLEMIVVEMNLKFGTGLFYHYNTIFQVSNGILLLMLFRNISVNERNGPAVERLAASAFPVYLMHEHPEVRALLWRTGLNGVLHSLTFWEFGCLCLLIPIAIFVVGFGLEQIRLAFLSLIQKTKMGKNVAAKMDSLFLHLDNLVL